MTTPAKAAETKCPKCGETKRIAITGGTQKHGICYVCLTGWDVDTLPLIQKIRQLESALARVTQERDQCLQLLRDIRGWDISIADRMIISRFLSRLPAADPQPTEEFTPAQKAGWSPIEQQPPVAPRPATTTEPNDE